MRRSRLPWLVAVPLMVAGSISAHGLAYRIVAPRPDIRAALLHDTGHDYLHGLSLVVGVLGALLVTGLVLRLAAAVRGGAPARVSPWPFFVLPIVGFTLQEHVERLVHDGAFPTGAVLQPTFLIGLALQLPFALAALAVAWALLEAAGRIGRTLAPAPPPAQAAGRALRLLTAAAPDLARPTALARGYGERGPPGFAC